MRIASMVIVKTNPSRFRRRGETFSRTADEEQTIIRKMLLQEGVEASKKEGPKFMQRLVAKQKARVKES